MSSKTDVPATEDEWEDVTTSLGRQWDFDKDGPLTGFYIGITEVDLKEKATPDRQTAKAHSFGLLDESGEIVFIWGSHELDTAMNEIDTNGKVRITSLGKDEFEKDGENRSVNRYRVQRPRQ